MLSLISDRVCKRPWNFERVPNSMIEGHDKALIFTSTKEACLAACLNEKNFVCRSAEYNYVTLQEPFSAYCCSHNVTTPEKRLRDWARLCFATSQLRKMSRQHDQLSQLVVFNINDKQNRRKLLKLETKNECIVDLV